MDPRPAAPDFPCSSKRPPSEHMKKLSAMLERVVRECSYRHRAPPRSATSPPWNGLTAQPTKERRRMWVRPPSWYRRSRRRVGRGYPRQGGPTLRRVEPEAYVYYAPFHPVRHTPLEEHPATPAHAKPSPIPDGLAASNLRLPQGRARTPGLRPRWLSQPLEENPGQTGPSPWKTCSPPSP